MKNMRFVKVWLVCSAFFAIIGFGIPALAADTKTVEVEEVACIQVALSDSQALQLSQIIVGAVLETGIPAGVEFNRNRRVCRDEGPEFGPVMVIGDMAENSETVELEVANGAGVYNLGSVEISAPGEQYSKVGTAILIKLRAFAEGIGLIPPLASEKGE